MAASGLNIPLTNPYSIRCNGTFPCNLVVGVRFCSVPWLIGPLLSCLVAVFVTKWERRVYPPFPTVLHTVERGKWVHIITL
ncbi:hypothetical protein VTN49DRAFT_5523 [Thermomyces lanuginosus]|uniref:uncharacterized protein n=1 Tax=Thermomyces lanuginosus TaxID=5541 RepID=UPI0037446926